MSLEQDLLNLKSKGEQLNTLRIQNATKLKGLEEEKNRLLTEAAELGIDPAKIEETLKQEEAALQDEFARAEADLTKVLGEVNGL